MRLQQTGNSSILITFIIFNTGNLSIHGHRRLGTRSKRLQEGIGGSFTVRGIWDAVINNGGYGKMQQGEGIMQPSKMLCQIKFGLQLEDLKSEKS